MAASWLFFFIVYIVNPKGMGFGDVRLSALNGFMTGWIAIGNAFLGIFLGLFLGAIIGVGLMLFRIKGRKDPIPYGPFLALGALLAIFGPVAAG
jgi:leader peptidase (prepilin peptidase)/N-methyltransferase